MKLPNSDEWMRMGYTFLGGTGAILWNKYLPLEAKGGGYIPPALIAFIILYNEDSGETEKDLAAAILGFSSTAQAISFIGTKKPEAIPNVKGRPLNRSETLSEESDKLQRVRNITGTLGTIAEIVSKFRGSS